jgi:hypothetical protein
MESDSTSAHGLHRIMKTRNRGFAKAEENVRIALRQNVLQNTNLESRLLLIGVMRMKLSALVPLSEQEGLPAVVTFPRVVTEEGIDHLLKNPLPLYPIQFEAPTLGAADDRISCLLVYPSLDAFMLRILNGRNLRILNGRNH